MPKTCRPWRAELALGILLAFCPCAFALDPSLDINQYAHTAWKIRDGFSKGRIKSIIQTPDGYLWLGTEFGLLRFDGVRVVRWQPPADQRLPSSDIWSLLAARDGTLWIGTSKGLASWKDGKLTQHGELAGEYIFRLLEDHEGTVWAGTIGIPAGKLCAIRNGIVQCSGVDAAGRAILGLYEDRKGNLWVGVLNGLWRWKPGAPKFYALPGEPNGIRALAEEDDGALLIGMRGGIRRFVDGKTEAYPLSGPVRQFEAEMVLRDHDGGLWIGSSKQGLLHVHQGTTDVFSQSDGLSGDGDQTIFEDREGNIWVASSDGLDRFRDFDVATLSVKQGLSNAEVASVLAARDGSVWLSTASGLDRWNNSQIAIFGGQGGKLGGQNPNSSFQDSRGRIWVSTSREFGYLENDRFVSVSSFPGASYVRSIAEDTAGNLWIANFPLGLFQLRGESVVQRIPWAKLGRKDFGDALAADPLQGGIWLQKVLAY